MAKVYTIWSATGHFDCGHGTADPRFNYRGAALSKAAAEGMVEEKFAEYEKSSDGGQRVEMGGSKLDREGRVWYTQWVRIGTVPNLPIVVDTWVIREEEAKAAE